MSRSRHHGCGRGCPVCGDAGETRRKREADSQRVDEREDPDPLNTMLMDEKLARVP